VSLRVTYLMAATAGLTFWSSFNGPGFVVDV
jgi:hypothetical protein